jgi:hypothetical protein
MNLEQQSKNILCNHLDILNKKLNDENELLYKKQFSQQNSPNINNPVSRNPENINYLKSSFISKKDCIYTPYEVDTKEWEQVFLQTEAKFEFNKHTKPKMNDYNCP